MKAKLIRRHSFFPFLFVSCQINSISGFLHICCCQCPSDCLTNIFEKVQFVSYIPSGSRLISQTHQHSSVIKSNQWCLIDKRLSLQNSAELTPWSSKSNEKCGNPYCKFKGNLTKQGSGAPLGGVCICSLCLCGFPPTVLRHAREVHWWL